ncbi:hypothetical protein FQN54_002973 [Arachnomyces sp. PD_36]|nr:hypothetical protein FQN54_002973 [Arachnomyces sp. PD_36]
MSLISPFSRGRSEDCSQSTTPQEAQEEQQQQQRGMTTSNTPPGSPPKGPLGPRDGPPRSGPGVASKTAQNNPGATLTGSSGRKYPSRYHRNGARAGPSRTSGHGSSGNPNLTQTPSGDNTDATAAFLQQLNEPPSAPIDGGVQKDGTLKIDFSVLGEDGMIMPPQAVIALVLNEAGRKLGNGMVYYCPSCYPDTPNVPQLFYFACEWSEEDKGHWDNAPHRFRLQMVTQVRSELKVLPLRALVFDEPQAKIQFTTEDCRLTSVVITYDRRPFIDWYRGYASRRDDTYGIIAVNLSKHKEWFKSIRCTDNIEIMTKLHEYFHCPIVYGLKNYGAVVERIMSCEERRRGHSIVVVPHNTPAAAADDDDDVDELEEGEIDEISTDGSDDGEPAEIIPLPLRPNKSLPSEEGAEEPEGMDEN